MNDNNMLGKLVRDKITGFSGVATSRLISVNGTSRYGVTPKFDKDTRLQYSNHQSVGEIFFDDNWLEVTGPGPIEVRETPSYAGNAVR